MIKAPATNRRVKEPIRSLRQEVYDRLRTLMNRGRLRPGKYRVTFAKEGFGKLVASVAPPLAIGTGVRVAPLTLDRIRHIYEILAALESTALRDVATRITPATVARMSQLNREMVRALDASDFTRFYDDNLALHDAYLAVSDNTEMVRQIHLLKQRLYDFPRLKGFVPEWERASVEEHHTLVRFLEQGNVGAAADLLRDVHWSFSYQEPFVRRYYTLQSSDAAAGDGAA